MIEDEGNGSRIEADVERVQHRTGHGHTEVALVQRRYICRHDGNRVLGTDTALRERRSQLPAACIGL